VNSSASLNGISKPVSKVALSTTGSVPQFGVVATATSVGGTGAASVGAAGAGSVGTMGATSVGGTTGTSVATGLQAVNSSPKTTITANNLRIFCFIIFSLSFEIY
jgi:hypothetical protein